MLSLLCCGGMGGQSWIFSTTPSDPFFLCSLAAATTAAASMHGRMKRALSIPRTCVPAAATERHTHMLQQHHPRKKQPQHRDATGSVPIPQPARGAPLDCLLRSRCFDFRYATHTHSPAPTSLVAAADWSRSTPADSAVVLHWHQPSNAMPVLALVVVVAGRWGGGLESRRVG